MSSELPAIIVALLGLVLGLGLLTGLEMLLMQTLSIAEKPESLIYPLIANLTTLLIMIAGAFLLFGLVFTGLIVAMDKGYESAEWVFLLGIASPLIIPILMILIRLILFVLMKVGGFGKGIVYSIVSTIAVLIGSSVVTFASLLGARLIFGIGKA